MLLVGPMAVLPASAPAASAGVSPIEEVESTLTDRYQTTVPQPVRRALGLRKRDRIRGRRLASRGGHGRGIGLSQCSTTRSTRTDSSTISIAAGSVTPRPATTVGLGGGGWPQP